MVTGEFREVWECGSCRMASRKPEVGAVPMPTGWEVAEDGEPKCLSCVRREDPARRAEASRMSLARERRREQAAEEADVKNAEVRALLTAHRHPHDGATTREVADAAGTGIDRVRAVRRELVAEGAIDPAEPGAAAPHGPDPDKARRAEAELREDHRRPDFAVAAAAGVSKRVVSRVRADLGLKWDARSRGREEARAALRRLGEVPVEAVAADLGLEHETARQRLDKLVEEGRASKRPDPRGRGRSAKRLYSAAATGASG